MEMLKTLLAMTGIDPEQLLMQAQAIGEGFVRLEQKIDVITANQHTIMVQLGLEIPPPSDEQAALIAAESEKVLAPYGGLANGATGSVMAS